MGRIVHITRRERFSSAHKLWRNDWDEAKNFEVFGKCANPNWHGHNYELFVTVKGEVSDETGFVANLKDIKDILRERVIYKLDHKNINLDVDFMQGKLTSTENVAIGIWDEIIGPLSDLGCILQCVKIVETENNFIEYYGE